MTLSNLFLAAQSQPVIGLGLYDWITLILYFSILIGVAWWVVRQKTETSADYFLAGKKATWVVIGASLFASNIGSEHLVGLAGTGASDGMAMAHYELHAWCLLILGWVMVPFYERSCVYTMPEFLEKRYCSAARWLLSIISLIAYILTKISVTLFAGGIVYQALFPIPIFAGIDNFWVGAIGMIVVTGVYTILGGLRAVLFTDLFQTTVLLIGSTCVLLIGLQQVGGWTTLKETVQNTDRIYGYKIVVSETAGDNSISGSNGESNSENNTAENNNKKPKTFLKNKQGQDIIVMRPKLADDQHNTNWLYFHELTKDDILNAKLEENLETEQFQNLLLTHSEVMLRDLSSVMPEAQRYKADHFNLWKPNSHPVFPWFGLLFGAPIVGLWYWTTDQYIVQRTLAAKNQREARRGTIFGAYLKMAPVFIFILPGMIAYGLAVQGKISAEVLHEPNQAFPILVREVLPVGLKGIVIGGLMAALMSSLASVFNSCSTLFTMDIYTKIYRNASEKHLVWVGRLVTGCMVILGLLWIPVIRHMPGTLYGYLQSVQAYIAPPIFAVFFLGVFFKRINAYGCMTGLVTGFILGMLRLVAEIAYNSGYAPELFSDGGFLQWFATASFTFVCIYLTLICSLLIVTVSLLTPKPREEQLAGLTYATSTKEHHRLTRESWNWLDVVLTCGLLVIIIAIYIYFTG
ncbi:MAG: sodium:solute symporter [Planctomycetaceae bacterium]|nr:sodium:solute symporter [Planctomycetaceae bacterium]